MTLTVTEMPSSFSGEALDFLNRSRLNIWPSIIQNAPGFQRDIKAIALSIITLIPRLISLLGIGLLCSPAGCIYHSMQAFRWKWKAVLVENTARSQALAWEHFKAACIDLAAIPITGLINLISVIVYGHFLPPDSYFSSSQVRVQLPADFELNQEAGPPLNTNLRSMYWGTTPNATPRSCPYNKLRKYATEMYVRNNRQILPSDHPNVVRAVCLGVFEEANNDSQAFPNTLFQRSAFLSRSYSFSRGNNSPNYRLKWQFVMYAIATIGLLVLTTLMLPSFMSVFISRVMSSLNESFLVSFFSLFSALFYKASLITFTGIPLVNCYIEAKKTWIEMCGSAEVELADQLMNKNTSDTTEDRKQARANIREAFFWLHKAANRGYEPAQQKFGLSLLMALPESPEGHFLNEAILEELLIAREGISWLQTAAINGSLKASQVLNRILEITWNRICQGIEGNSQVERLKSMLTTLNRTEICNEFKKLMFPSNINEEKKTALLQAIRNALGEHRRKRVALQIKDATTMIPDLAKLASEYVL